MADFFRGLATDAFFRLWRPTENSKNDEPSSDREKPAVWQQDRPDTSRRIN